MDIHHHHHALQQAIEGWKQKCKLEQNVRVCLVPTMGALHAGHLSLVEQARAAADKVVVSIFVNPAQFGPKEDLATYPRTMEADLAACRAVGVDAVYAPSVEEIYPKGVTLLEEVAYADVIEGQFRPPFFYGVATVVKRLFELVRPDSAVFGEKDYQQWRVVQELVARHALPVEILAAPTVREEDGLAMASRNAYLSKEDRQKAPLLYETMMWVRQQLLAGTASPPSLLDEATARLLEGGFAKVDYLTLCDAKTLEPLEAWPASEGKPARLLAACWLPSARLIDNIAV